MKMLRRRWWLAIAAAAATLAAVLAAVVPSVADAAPVRAEQGPAEATGLEQLTGLLPASHLTLESAIQVNLSNETVRLPLYPGIAYKGTRTRRRSGTCCWTPPTRLAHDLG